MFEQRAAVILVSWVPMTTVPLQPRLSLLAGRMLKWVSEMETYILRLPSPDKPRLCGLSGFVPVGSNGWKSLRSRTFRIISLI